MAAPEPRRVQFSTGCCFSWKMLFRFRLAAAIPSTISVTRRSVSPCFFSPFFVTHLTDWLTRCVRDSLLFFLSLSGRTRKKKERKKERKNSNEMVFFSERGRTKIPTHQQQHEVKREEGNGGIDAAVAVNWRAPDNGTLDRVAIQWKSSYYLLILSLEK